MVEPLRLALVNNFDTILQITNKMLILKAIWGLSRLGLVKEDLLKQVEEGFTSTRPELIDQMNLKDLQTLLETLVFYESISYNPKLADRITLKIMKMLDSTNKAEIAN